MAIDPIATITLAFDRTMLHAPVSEPTIGMGWAMRLFEILGVPYTLVDGQLLPGSILLFILAVWGMWHLTLMAINAALAVPGLIKRVKNLAKKDGVKDE